MKIYDCFTFFNELELLKLRLAILNDTVDYFVIVEANKTFTNIDKEYHFEREKHFFKEYLDKIIHIKVDNSPDYDDAWEVEYFQRNCIAKGLRHCEPDDVIIISDVDEIPNPAVLSVLSAPQGLELLDRTPLALEQDLFYYFLNCKSKAMWNGSVIAKAGKGLSPQMLRNARNSLPRLSHGGWHFSYLGGVDRIILKINSYAETQTNTPQTNDPEFIKHCIYNGIDIYGRKGLQFEYEFIDIAQLPAAIHSFAAQYPHLYLEGKT